MNIKEYAFEAAYKLVFNNNGDITACGRQKCKELISFANEIEPTVNHGDITTGFMNVENIKSLHIKIKNSKELN